MKILIGHAALTAASSQVNSGGAAVRQLKRPSAVSLANTCQGMMMMTMTSTSRESPVKTFAANVVARQAT
jgi:hypothetical protein